MIDQRSLFESEALATCSTVGTAEMGTTSKPGTVSHAQEASGRKPAPPVLAAEEQISRVLRSLHAKDGTAFREAVDPLLHEHERELIQAAETCGLLIQACHMWDRVIERLTRSFGDLVGYSPSCVVEVIERAEQITPKLRCLVLELNSRGLVGPVAFQVGDPRSVSEVMPPAAIQALGTSISWWQAVAYLEPAYQGRTLLRSLKEVREARTRKPRDPLLVGYLGAGPRHYGYRLTLTDKYGRQKTVQHQRLTTDLLFIVAHWD